MPAATISVAENERRLEVGLRQIERGWFLHRREFNAEDWKTAKDSPLAKRVQRNADGKPVWVEDYYHSGRTFRTDEGQMDEMITVHFDYLSNWLEVLTVSDNPALGNLMDDMESRGSTRKLERVRPFIEQWKLLEKAE